MIVFAVTPDQGIVIDLVGAMLIGFGWEFVFIGGQSTVVFEVPEEIRGRMMGLFFILVTPTTAAGALGLGALINHLGIMTTFLATAFLAVLAGLLLLALERRATPTPRSIPFLTDTC